MTVLSFKWYDRLWKCLWWQHSLILSESLDRLKCLFLHIIHQIIHRTVYSCKLTQKKIVFYEEVAILKFLTFPLYNKMSSCKMSHGDTLRFKRKIGFYYLKKKKTQSHSTVLICVSPVQGCIKGSASGMLCALPMQSLSVSSSAPYALKWTDGCLSTWLLTDHCQSSCNEWRSSLIFLLVQSGCISLCSNSCMKFRRGHLGYSTAGAAVLLVPFSGLKEKGARIFLSPAVLTIKPRVRCRTILQIKSLEPRACTVRSSLVGH